MDNKDSKFMSKEEFYKYFHRFFYNKLSLEDVNDEAISQVAEVIRVDDLSDDSSMLDAANRILEIASFADIVKNRYFIRFAFADNHGKYLKEETFFENLAASERGREAIKEIIEEFFDFVEPPNYGTGSDYYYDEETSALGYAILALIKSDMSYLNLAMKYLGNIVDWEHDSFCQNELIPYITEKLGDSKEGIDFRLTANLLSWIWTENATIYFLDRVQEGENLHEWIQQKENREHVLNFIGNFDSLGINFHRDWFDEKAREIVGTLNSMFDEEMTVTTNLAEDIKVIKKGSFRSKELEDVNIPESVEIIEENAFYGNNLKTLDLPDSVQIIGEHAFAYNQLTSVKLSKNLVKIEEKAFTYNQLSEIMIPDHVEIIGEAAFFRNELKKVDIPESVHTIGKFAFTRNSIEDLTIPEGVKIIDDFAFEKNGLKDLVIPKSVETIGYQAFSENKLKSITIEGDATRFNDDWKRIGFPPKLKPKK